MTSSSLSAFARALIFPTSFVALLSAGIVSATHASAQESLGDASALDPNSVVATTLDSGDTAWVLASTALVLFMTLPGLALFYGGLVRSRNVLSLLMQCLTLTALLSVLWVMFGYSLAFDAGGIVVHITAGVSALVACIMVGSRSGYPTQLVPPHNMTMTFTGTAMLWVGWFGFNAGSALAANGTAASALLVTHLSASVATLVWIALEWKKLGRPGVLGAATGSIAGLAAITPASGYVGPLGAIVIGTVSALVCYFFATTVKRHFRYDDSLDVFGVHGVGGIIGTILVAVFASTTLGGSVAEHDIVKSLNAQCSAAAITTLYSIVATMAILKAVDLMTGLRVTGVAEQQGLDLSEHEERGYTI